MSDLNKTDSVFTSMYSLSLCIFWCCFQQLGTESEDTGPTEEGNDYQSTVDVDNDVLTSSNTSLAFMTQEEDNSWVNLPKGLESGNPNQNHLSITLRWPNTQSGPSADCEELKVKALQVRLRRNIMNMIYDIQEAEQTNQNLFQFRPYTPLPTHCPAYHVQQNPQQEQQATSSTQPFIVLSQNAEFWEWVAHNQNMCNINS